MSDFRHAVGIPAGLFAALALAVASADDELPLPWFPPPAESQGTGLEVHLDEAATPPPAVSTEPPAVTPAAAVPAQESPAEDVADEPSHASRAEEAAAVIAAPERDPLPVLRADADMSECARDLLRTRLASAVAEEDILAAMALEAELLTLCRERQELVLTLYQVEAALSALQGDGQEGEAEEPPLALLDQFVAPAMPPPETVEEEPPPPPAETVSDSLPPEDVPEEDPPPALAWFSILGVKGALRAGITDGLQVWWVTEGAELPGGVTVASISGAPPSVVVAGDEITTLPYLGRPGGS